METLQKPLMRGWFHAFGAVLAAVGTVFLMLNTHHDPVKFAAYLVYGTSLIVLLAFSATYHIPNWSPTRRTFLRRIDHANIYILIAGTYTPVVAVLMHGAWRISMLVAVWAVAILGVGASMPAIRHRRRLMVAIYIAMGWAAVVAFPNLIAAAGAATLLIVLGGVLYSVGALAYATRWPKLWPRVFSYHEVFHVFVLAASVVFYLFILGVVSGHQTQ